MTSSSSWAIAQNLRSLALHRLRYGPYFPDPDPDPDPLARLHRASAGPSRLAFSTQCIEHAIYTNIYPAARTHVSRMQLSSLVRDRKPKRIIRKDFLKLS